MTQNLAARFEEAASFAPDRPAVICGDTSITHAELDRRTGSLAAELADRGIGPGDRIAIALRNRIDYVELLLAAFKLSALPVNVNRQYVGAELAHVLTDSDPAMVIGEDAVIDRLEATGCALPRLVFRCDESYRSLAAGDRQAPDNPDRSGDDHYVIYTGGTTGSPKGVLWRHEDLYDAALGGSPSSHRRRRSSSNSRMLSRPVRTFAISPLTHGTAQWLTLSSLLRAGTVVLDPGRTFDAESTLRLIESHRVSHLVIVGDAFALPLVDVLRERPDRFDTTSVTTIVNGGARLSPRLAAELCDRLSGVVIVDGYGTSETGGQGTRVITSGVGSAREVSFTPSDGTILLDDDLRPLEATPGAVGRIARSGSVPLGYWQDPVGTARSFPVIDGVRHAVTADIGRVEPSGEIALLGRVERLITSGGEKIHPAEIESVASDHPAVRDVLVVAGPDERFGEVVTALVHLEPGRDLTCDELATWCRPHLAPFKLPRQLRRVDLIRRFGTGKPDLAWAADVARSQPAPSSASTGGEIT